MLIVSTSGRDWIGNAGSERMCDSAANQIRVYNTETMTEAQLVIPSQRITVDANGICGLFRPRR